MGHDRAIIVFDGDRQSIGITPASPEVRASGAFRSKVRTDAPRGRIPTLSCPGAESAFLQAG